VLDDVLAWIDCELVTTHDAGDHVIVIGEVKHLDVSRTVAPLMFFQGGYGRFSTLSLVAGAEDDLSAQLRLASIARPHLERIAAEFGVQAHTNALAGDRIIQLAWVGQDSDSAASSRVGLRLPFAPPMGLLFVAWEGRNAREGWLSRSRQAMSEHARERYEDACALVREQGWLATPSDDRLADVEGAVLRLAADGHLPSLEREIASALDDYSDRFVTVEPRGWIDQPSGLSAPVFDHGGKVALAMSVQGLADRDSAQVAHCLNALMAAAAEVTKGIGGTMPTCGDEVGR
jgi:DNA-binding IclR family transcriptional regulator